ncbi:hypothetical protein HWV62_29052 [Athelia sp. TMB]|nr:hypothetical protein HWV62_29052 [Athelia sp. TMB]
MSSSSNLPNGSVRDTPVNPVNHLVQLEPLPSWTPIQRPPSSEVESSEDELDTLASPLPKQAGLLKLVQLLFDAVELPAPSSTLPSANPPSTTVAQRTGKFLGVVIELAHPPHKLHLSIPARPMDQHRALDIHSLPPSSPVTASVPPSSSGFDTSTSFNSLKPPSSLSMTSTADSISGKEADEEQPTQLTALNNTLQHLHQPPPSDSVTHPSSASTTTSVARLAHARKAKVAIKSSPYPPPAVRLRTRKQEHIPFTEEDVDSLLGTEVAPLSLPGRAKGVNVETAANLGPELAAGWGPLGSETKSAKERRLATNLRFVKTETLGSAIGTAVREPAWLRRKKSDVFVEHLEAMFGPGSVDRGSTSSKPKGRSTVKGRPQMSRRLLPQLGQRSRTVSPPVSASAASIVPESRQSSSHTHGGAEESEEEPHERQEEEESSEVEAEHDAVQGVVVKSTEPVSEQINVDGDAIPSEDDMAMWATAIHSLAKGKVETSREKMEYVGELVRRADVSKRHADLELVKGTDLLEVMQQLADLEDAPFEEELGVAARAKEVVKFWQTKIAIEA